MEYLVFLGAAINILGTGVYIRDTLRGRTKPNRVTWLLWSLIPLIAFFAELSSGVGLAAVPVFIASVSPFLVFTASFFNKNAYWRLGAFDYGCGALSIVALVLWRVTADPNSAIVFSIIADGLAAIPTMVKSWHFPQTESGATFAGGLFSALTGIAVLPAYTFNGAAFLFYVISQNSAMLILIYRKRIRPFLPDAR